MATDDYMDYDAFLDFAAKLAAEMGLELDQTRLWTWCVFLVSYSGDGTGYSITRPRGNAMTKVAPLYPATTWTFPSGAGDPIGVSISRGPHTVASEIQRRLAGRYRTNLEALAEHDAEVARLLAHRAGLAAQISGMFTKVAAPSHCQSNHSTTLIVYGPDQGGGNLRFSGAADDIEFYRFRVPARVAVQMLALYAAAIAATGDQAPGD